MYVMYVCMFGLPALLLLLLVSSSLSLFAPSTLQECHACMYVCMCVCVCVSHLERCKTSICCFLPNLQGVVAGSRVYHQRRRSGFPGDTWPDQPCVPANFTGMGRGSTQEPPRRPFETSIYCTVVAIWNQFWSFTIS